MKLPVALFLACFATPALAGDCLVGPPTAADPGMSVVAPEMQRVPPSDGLCVSASDAVARIHAQQAIVAANAPSAYVKQTEFDNSPWRFDMSQGGKRMTAEEFDAWMKAKGIRVATGKPAVVTEAPPPPPPPPPGG
jgi:hypothetical protein